MTKDRLGDLVDGTRRGNDDNDDDDDDDQTLAIDLTSGAMQTLLAEFEDVRQTISSIQDSVAEVKIAHSDVLSAPHTDEKLKMKLEDLTADIKRNANRVRAKLKLMQPDEDAATVADSLPADLRIRETQHAALTRLFVDTMIEYNRIQTEHRDRCKARIKRQLEITGRTTTNDELEEMLEQGNPAVFTQGIIMETQQARQTFADIEARHADIVKLENSIRELHGMFMDMAVLVESQGALVDNIEYHVSKTTDFVADGARDIESGKRYQSKARRKKIIIGICLLVAAIIVIAILASSLR